MAIPFEDYKPKDMNEATWVAICDAWANGLSDRQVAFRVSKQLGINLKYETLRDLVHEDKRIAELRENLMTDLVSDSKLNVASAIRNGDTATAKWYLERKAQDEFSTKSSIAFDDASRITLSIEDKQKALEEMIENFGDGE